jgi:hypothetical protein
MAINFLNSDTNKENLLKGTEGRNVGGNHKQLYYFWSVLGYGLHFHSQCRDSEAVIRSSDENA